MACITAGRSRSCTDKLTGGNITLYVADRNDVDTVTTDPTGEVTAVTMLAAAVFYKLEFRRDTAQFTETANNENGLLIDQQFLAVFAGRKQADRNVIQELLECQCGLVVIHKENTGRSWFWGFEEGEEAFATANTGDSGTAKGDLNQESITLSATASTKAVEFTGTVPV